MRKANEHDDDDENDNGKRREFPDRARGRRRPRSVGEEAIDDDHDDETSELVRQHFF